MLLEAEEEDSAILNLASSCRNSSASTGVVIEGGVSGGSG